jgi:SAM-dependent methyltransferase
MNETEKTNKLRNQSFFDSYFQGKVIDIGGGNSLVLPNAERFDIEDGDANEVTKYRPKESYDTVYSSHCLEHMIDPVKALNEWWRLVKPGGYMVLVVPDENLYEQGFWPSIFNEDHKATFRIRGASSWSPVSHNISELASSLPEADVLKVTIYDQNYNHRLKLSFPPKRVRIPNIWFKIKYVLRKIPIAWFQNDMMYKKVECILFRIPIDQTLSEALAQIEVVVKKNLP